MSSGEVKHWFQGSSWWPECVALLSANVPLVGSLHWQTRWSPSECLQVSPKMSSTFLHLVISRHISSICGALDFDPYAIGCFKMFQDPLSIVQLFLNWLHLQNGPSKPFFWFTPSFTTKSDLCEILWNRFRSSQNCHSTSSLTPLCWLVQLRSLPLELSIHWMRGKMRKALGFPAASFNLALGTLGPSAKISHQNRWFSQPETAIFDGDIYLSVDRQVNKDPFWMVTHVLFA